MKLIPLKYKTESHFAMVDDEDYELLNKIKWYLSNDKRYGQTTSWNETEKRYVYVSIHREIGKKHLNLSENQQIDHIDGNGLNNQKSNLRICNQSQNLINKKKYLVNGKACYSKYKGVSFDKRRNSWISKIKINQKFIHLGYWKIERLAAIAYDIKVLEFFGEFAILNIKNPDLKEVEEVKNILKFKELCPFIPINNERKFSGVKDPTGRGTKYNIRLKFNKFIKQISIYGFNTKKEAAIARDLLVYKYTKGLRISLNYPDYDFDNKKEEILNSSPQKYKNIYNTL